jgi:hypothetical protein
MFLTISLVSCQTYAKPSSCPAPPPSLLQREPSLAEVNPLKIPLTEQQALELWAKDAAQYDGLRERHADLQGWIRYWCLAGKSPKPK